MLQKIKKTLTVLIASSAISGCELLERTAISQPFDPGFNGLMFNDVYNSYYERPTFGEVYFAEHGKEANLIYIRVKQYKPDTWAVIYVEREQVQEHIESVETYLKWQQIALNREDLLNKEVAKIESIVLGNKTVYTLFSANKSTHLLSVNMGGDSVFDVGLLNFYLDRVQAKKYLTLLKKFDSNEFVSEDVSHFYSK